MAQMSRARTSIWSAVMSEVISCNRIATMPAPLAPAKANLLVSTLTRLSISTASISETLCIPQPQIQHQSNILGFFCTLILHFGEEYRCRVDASLCELLGCLTRVRSRMVYMYTSGASGARIPLSQHRDPVLRAGPDSLDERKTAFQYLQRISGAERLPQDVQGTLPNPVGCHIQVRSRYPGPVRRAIGAE